MAESMNAQRNFVNTPDAVVIIIIIIIISERNIVFAVFRRNKTIAILSGIPRHLLIIIFD